jgi:heme/copper-type cytochrome/quinol oxidase subunit 3
MSTDATGLPSEGAGAVNAGLETATEAMTRAGARQVRTLDDRLALLLSRMIYVALSFFFACFYFALVYLQLINQNGLWKPAAVDHPPGWIGASEVALVLAAGLAYFWAQWAGLYTRNFDRLRLGLWAAASLCVAACGVHIYELHAPGFPSLQSGAYVSVFIALEGVFTIVLIISTLVLLGVANRAQRGLFRQSGIAVEAFGEYFGWLSAIALLNFLALYVEPFFPIA